MTSKGDRRAGGYFLSPQIRTRATIPTPASRSAPLAKTARRRPCRCGPPRSQCSGPLAIYPCRKAARRTSFPSCQMPGGSVSISRARRSGQLLDCSSGSLLLTDSMHTCHRLVFLCRFWRGEMRTTAIGQPRLCSTFLPYRLDRSTSFEPPINFHLHDYFLAGWQGKEDQEKRCIDRGVLPYLPGGRWAAWRRFFASCVTGDALIREAVRGFGLVQGIRGRLGCGACNVLHPATGPMCERRSTTT